MIGSSCWAIQWFQSNILEKKKETRIEFPEFAVYLIYQVKYILIIK